MAATIQTILKPTRARGLDTSTGEQIVGNQLLADPSFDTDVAAGGTNPGTWKCEDSHLEITGGKAVWSAYTGTGNRRLVDNVATGPFTDVTARYRVRIEVSDYTQGALRVVSGSYSSGFIIDSAGTHIIDMSPAVGAGNVHIEASKDTDSQGDAVIKVSEITIYKLESFPNNNHAQIYSGRGLEFDGVTDYLSVSNIDGTTNFDEGNAYSWATWINIYSIASGVNWFLGKGSSHPNIFVRHTDGRLAFREGGSNAAYHYISTTALQINTWYRLVVTADTSNNMKCYINGVLDNTLSEGDSPYYGSGTFGVGGSNLGTEFTMTRIGGGYSSNSYPLNGMMSDFQIWDTTLTQDDVTYDYLNPEQLALNRGGTSLTNSNLKLWYPMNDGHRSDQSYVLDASNTGLGDNVALNGTFDTDLSQWTVISNTGDNNVTWVDGKARLLYDPSVSTSALGISSSAHSPMTTGVDYKVTFDLVATSGELKFYNHGTTHATGLGTGSHTMYFNANGADIKFFRDASGTYTDVTIDNVKIYPINNKNNATTVFYGEELVTNGDMELDDNWNDQSSPTTNERSSTQANNGTYSRKVVGDSTGDGLKSDTFSLVAGRTYQVEFYYYLETGSNNLLVRLQDGDGSNLGSSQSLYTKDAWTKVTFSIVAETTGSSSYFQVYQNGAGSSTFYIDDVSVKEIGVASGWTDADQQLDIPQTALQSYNQLAWFDGHNNYVSIADHNDFSFTDGSNDDESFSLSAWINMNDATNFPIICKDSSSHREWSFVTGSTDKLTFWVFDNSAGAYQGRYYNAALTSYEGKWIHVVATYNGNESDADAGVAIYLNGEVIDDTNFSSGSYEGMENKDSVVAIGARLQGNLYANGAVTECSIWNKELSATEVTELYNDGLALNATTHSGSSNLIGYWRNNGLATWQDLTGNNRDGTPTNITETMLITAGVDSSRDSQGFFMNKQRTTNSLNFPTVLGGNSNKEHAVIPTGSGTTPGDNLHFVGRPFSFTCWVKTHYVTGAAQIIFDRGDGTDGYLLKVSGTGIPVFTTEEDGTEISATASGGNGGLTAGVMTNGIWYFIAGTHEGIASSADQKLYVGTSNITPALITTQASGVGMETSAANLYIGRRFNGGLPYNGEIDDLCFYDNKELTLKEITRNYNAGKRSHR